MHRALAELQIAFGVHVLRRLAEADGVIDYAELQLVERAYPAATLKDLGYLGPEGFTEAWHGAVGEAVGRLGVELDIAAKLALLTEFHAVAVADGELHPQEFRVLQEAAGVLGVGASELSAHLDAQALGADSAVPPVRPR